MNQNASQMQQNSNMYSCAQQKSCYSQSQSEYQSNSSSTCPNAATSMLFNPFSCQSIEQQQPLHRLFNRQKLNKEQRMLLSIIKEWFYIYRVKSMYYSTLISLIGSKNQAKLNQIIRKGYLKDVGTADMHKKQKREHDRQHDEPEQTTKARIISIDGI